ncbi:DUF1365 domain-containing protein [Laribacter hongkongensis]|uniref:Cyclopropane fatty acid synthase n=1 Tax=Laribacter hongkongensis TaxID=168471 RepID=A0A248LIU8_9NEIS|nr:DUF1365 domain-containing protein [Laribacter hongkongensis]ASJ24429.1 cyclopropane fatty acid synthase [Laribacter hongkongensis]MCG9040248.1 DUF1365 domain-containing protein [Laribacter hongkongensis]MCG9068352.1 DUF1365 domain-containing protein [Laribacter hongkongensis]MCG9088231.1 DUF1365 domain-containing protein [Laribacter hongkongensis]MCG9108598.1 DUF1365 domain-containing protein [Laribacter hongkongensis]
MTNAYLVRGVVMHRRLRPVRHRFLYPVFAVRLRLSALDDTGNAWFGVDRCRLMSVRTRDYGPRDGSPLLPWIHRQLAEAGLPHDGEVWLQTFPRLFGYVFNPVSFWYCHDAEGRLVAVLADVNNTFGEHHAYLLANRNGEPLMSGSVLTCRKCLHVSPFCRVEGHYRFRLTEKPDHMLMRIDYHDAEGAVLNTAVSGRMTPLTSASAGAALLRQPLLTVSVIVRIHWQALRLWLKKVPFFGKPRPPASTLTHGQECQP